MSVVSTPPPKTNVVQLEQVSSKSVKLESLTLVSMNLAGCIPSQAAPQHWNRDIVTEYARAEILRNSPDILALQECPGGVEWAQSVFGK